jgi:hypothetical protein
VIERPKKQATANTAALSSMPTRTIRQPTERNATSYAHVIPPAASPRTLSHRTRPEMPMVTARPRMLAVAGRWWSSRTESMRPPANANGEMARAFTAAPGIDHASPDASTRLRAIAGMPSAAHQAENSADG